MEIRKANVKDPDKVRIEDVLVKMETGAPKEEEKDEEELEWDVIKKQTAASQGMWFGIAGFTKEVS